MSIDRALVIAAALMSLTSLAPPVHASGDPVTAAECEYYGGAVFTDEDGFDVCYGGVYDGRYVV